MSEVCSGGCRSCGLSFKDTQERRPLAFNGRKWLEVLRLQYGENLQGLSLDELSLLPDAEWEQPKPKDSLWRKLGFGALRHPSQPNFSFDDCPDFFDGASYLTALTEKYGEDLRELPAEAVRNLPTLELPEDNHPSWPRHVSPSEAIELNRRSYVFLHMPVVRHPAEEAA
jgi:hypothetical protein